MKVNFNNHQIEAFARRWRITEFALFGSVLRDDFRPDSDVDVMVSFEPDAKWTLFDLFHMRDELVQIFGRKVDLFTRRAVEMSHNKRRRESILSSARTVYAG